MVCAPAVTLAQSAVVVAQVVEAEVGSAQRFVGTIVPTKRAVVGSAVDGRVSEFPLNAGDRVEENGKLAQILTRTIELEKKAAEEELKLREHELAELKESRPDEIKRATADLNAAAAAAELAKANFVRAQQLHESGTITRSQLDAAESANKVAFETHEERQAALKLLNDGARQEVRDQATARIEMQKAVVERLADQISKYTVKSRFAGYVVTEHTEIGAWVKRGDPVAEVVALDLVDVEAHVLDQQVVHVRIGMPVRVEVPALNNPALPGRVEHIVPQADVRTRTFPVHVRVENVINDDGPMLKAGMLARVFLPTGPTEKALLIPKDAIVLGGRRPLVYVVDRESPSQPVGTVRPVPVELGVAVGKAFAITGEGITKGVEVVVRGNERLRPNQPVSVTSEVEVDYREPAVATPQESDDEAP